MTSMQELLAETSQLAAASLIRAPRVAAAPPDPVLTWRERFQALVRPEAPHLLRAISFERIEACMADLLPLDPNWQPRWHEHENAVWIRSSGALYDGGSGVALPGSVLTRFPRHRQTPHCHTFRVELTAAPESFPGLDRAIYLPFAVCSNFGHFVTETLSFLWPFVLDGADAGDRDGMGWPVLLTGCRPEDPSARILHSLVRERHGFALLEDHLPPALQLARVRIPEPSFRLHAVCSATYLRTAQALGDWLLHSEPGAPPPLPASGRVYISRSGLQGEVRSVDQEAALEALLAERGWLIFHPEQHPLVDQIAVYRAARVIAGFEGSALHGLSFLGQNPPQTSLILLGDAFTSPDYFLQFRAQGLQGFFIQCVDLDPAAEPIAQHLRRRLLNGAPESLVSMIEALAAAA